MPQAEQGPLYFGDQQLQRGSHPTWVIGQGHKPLPEARAIALDELSAAEAKLDEKQAALDEAHKAFVAAKHARDRAYNERQEARLDVKRKQEHVAYVCSTSAEPVQ